VRRLLQGAGVGPAEADVQILGGMQTISYCGAQEEGLNLRDWGLLCHSLRRGRQQPQLCARKVVSATGAFYAMHREEVDNSHDDAHAKWMEWVNSWSNSFCAGPEAGAACSVVIEQELTVLITARR
jgi:hypothetical protein